MQTPGSSSAAPDILDDPGPSVATGAAPDDGPGGGDTIGFLSEGSGEYLISVESFPQLLCIIEDG